MSAVALIGGATVVAGLALLTVTGVGLIAVLVVTRAMPREESNADLLPRRLPIADLLPQWPQLRRPRLRVPPKRRGRHVR